MSSPVPATAPNPRRWWILGVLCLSLLVVVVDNTVLNVAIPTLIRDFDATNADIQWFLDAYIVVFAGLLLAAGVISDRHGRRLGLIIGLILFGGASLAAARAGSAPQLIAARVGMGAGAAFLMPGTLSILTSVFEESERKKAIAIWSSVLTLAALGGPTLGGALLEHFWWGSIFLINVPIAAISIVAAVLIIPESRGPANRPDLLGAAIITVAMVSLVWGVIAGPRDGWSSGPTLTAFAVAVVAMAIFVFWELRCPFPMLPMRLFRNRNFTGSSLALVLFGFTTAGILLALTQRLQLVLGYSPLRAGLALGPMIIASIVCNGLSVMIDKRLGARITIAIGLVAVAAGCTVLATTSAGDGYPQLAVGLALLGAGSGIGGPPVYATLLGTLPPEQAGVGSAVNDTILQTGQSLSVAVLGSLLSVVYTRSMPDGTIAAAKESIGDALAIAAGNGDATLASSAKDAFVSAMSVTSLVGVGAGLLAAIGVLVLLRTQRNAPAQSQDEAVKAGDAPEVAVHTTD